MRARYGSVERSNPEAGEDRVALLFGGGRRAPAPRQVPPLQPGPPAPRLRQNQFVPS
jgi:hypothetical protein